MIFPSIRVHFVDDDDDDYMPDVTDQFSRLGTQDDDFGSTVTPTRGNRFGNSIRMLSDRFSRSSSARGTTTQFTP